MFYFPPRTFVWIKVAKAVDAVETEWNEKITIAEHRVKTGTRGSKCRAGERLKGSNKLYFETD